MRTIALPSAGHAGRRALRDQGVARQAASGLTRSWRCDRADVGGSAIETSPQHSSGVGARISRSDRPRAASAAGLRAGCHPIWMMPLDSVQSKLGTTTPGTQGRPQLLMEGCMNDTDVDELGPVDYVVVEFPADRANFSGEMAAELTALVERGVVRVLDLILLKKELDGSVEGFESHDFGDVDLGGLRELETELALLLAEEDVESIGAALEPGSVAAVLVWENVWAAPFGSAVRRSGGQLVAGGRIPIQALAAAIEADDAIS